MENFLLYILRSGLYIGIFYAFFLLVMRKTTFFRLNRILLLAGTFICMLLPLLRIRTIEILASVGQMEAVSADGFCRLQWPFSSASQPYCAMQLSLLSGCTG